MRFSSILLLGCLLLLSAAPKLIDAGIHFKEPNQYIDVTRYGVRGGNASTKATTTSGSRIVTLAAASTFQNGDGVTIYGAGATNSMPTLGAPTVTPSIARVMTGTGDVVKGLTGARTYKYKIIARDIGGGYTAASSAGTTATGAASLGSQSVSITLASRYGAAVTVTTSATHGLAVGAMVILSGQSDTSFNGWYQVATVPDNMHFTFTGGQITANGASASATGGTVFWFNCNHISWSAVTGAYQYYIYSDRGSPGTFNIIGASWPVNPANASFTDGTLSFDDFGSTMTSNFTAYPASIPSTAPSVAINDYLTTTIVSGTGTTILALASNAGQSVSGATILNDDAPNIKAAATAASGLPIYLPHGVNQPVVNSPLNLASLNTPMVGSLQLDDVILLGSQTKWDGNLFPVKSSAGQFQFQSTPQIGCAVSPCILVTNGNAPYIAHFQINGKGNGQLMMIVDGGGGSPFGAFEYLYFASGGGSNDYTNIGLVFRGVFGASAAGRLKAVNFVNTQLALGTSATPSLYIDVCGQLTIESIFNSGRGLLIRDPNSVAIYKSYIQGANIPFLTLAGDLSAGTGGGIVDLNHLVLDTSGQPAVTILNSTGSLTALNLRLYDVSLPAGGGPQISGVPAAFLTGGTNGQNTAAISNANFTDNNVNVVGAGSFTVALPTPAVPTVNIVAGGSLPIAAQEYQITWVDVFGKESAPSAITLAMTTSGNQTAQVTPPAAPSNSGIVGYFVYRHFLKYMTRGLCSTPQALGTTTTLNGSSETICTTSGSPPQFPGGGIVDIGSGGVASALFRSPNCNVNSASPAACGSAPNGVVVVPTTTTTYTVNTTAVTANSRIIIMPITDNSGVSGSPTCNAPPTPFIGYESRRAAGTSFTFRLPSTTGTSCWVYWIVN